MTLCKNIICGMFKRRFSTQECWFVSWHWQGWVKLSLDAEKEIECLMSVQWIKKSNLTTINFILFSAVYKIKQKVLNHVPEAVE